jgi:two-component system chemotaxis response regulator CheB
MVRIVLATNRIELQESIEKAVNTDGQFQIVGFAGNGIDAVQLTREFRPDIVVIGLRLQKLDGVETTREIMIEAPTPIVMVADRSDGPAGKHSVLALEAGALAVIPAPYGKDVDSARKFLSTLKAMSQVKVVRRWRGRSGSQVHPRRGGNRGIVPPRVVAIAASTGGPAAIQSILKDLPGDFPVPILAIQHIASGFVDGVAEWLDASVSLTVKMAKNNDILKPGRVYLAPDGHQLGVANKSRVLVADAPPVKGFRPSATYLFDSVARVFGNEALGIILTGMGDDGVEGLRLLHKAGGGVIAQDESSSIVFGMPKAAIEAGVADRILPLAGIAREIIKLVKG